MIITITLSAYFVLKGNGNEIHRYIMPVIFYAIYQGIVLYSKFFRKFKII